MIISRSLFISVIGGALFMLCMCYAPASSADDPRDVVRDSRGNIIRNTWANCVRTEWDIGNDPCAPRVARTMPAPAIRTARELTQQERTVYFAFNHADITPSEGTKLNNLAAILQNDKEVRDVHIVGYADRIGSVSYNKRLSEERAKHVENYLHDHDYLNTQLAKVRWVGKAESRARCPGKLTHKQLIECLQPDRRVEVEIEYYTSKP